MVNQNAVGWFEVPVTDMERAVGFYEQVLGVELERHELGPLKMAWFPMVQDGSGAAGSLVENKFYEPSPNGVLVYFTAPSGDLRTELKRVKPAGGSVEVPRRRIREDYGFMAVIRDSEGNRVALHSRA